MGEPYPFGMELVKNMKKWIDLPINQVTILSPSDDYVKVDVCVIMTREQLQALFEQED